MSRRSMFVTTLQCGPITFVYATSVRVAGVTLTQTMFTAVTAWLGSSAMGA